MHIRGDSEVVRNLNFQISLLQSGTRWINPNLFARSPPPPPLLTSCAELKLLHEKSCLQPRCEYLYAHCQHCGVCKGGRESASEEERWREYAWILDTTGELSSAHSTHRAEGTSTVRRQLFTYSPSPAIGFRREWSSLPPESTSLRWRASKRSASAR